MLLSSSLQFVEWFHQLIISASGVHSSLYSEDCEGVKSILRHLGSKPGFVASEAPIVIERYYHYMLYLFKCSESKRYIYFYNNSCFYSENIEKYQNSPIITFQKMTKNARISYVFWSKKKLSTAQKKLSIGLAVRT